MNSIEENIPLFISITNCSDANTAKHYLEMCNNDLNQSIQLYFDTSHNNNDNYTEPMTFNTEALNDFPEEEVFIPEVQYGGVGGYYEDLRDEESSLDFEVSDGDNSSDESDDSDVVEIDYNGNFITKETHEEKLRKMFSKPMDLIFNKGHDITTLKFYAKKKSKWILINIQDVNNFECMKLNRDIWSDPIIKSIIKKNFLFNQFDKTERAGREYLFLYPLSDKIPGLVRRKPESIINDGVVRDDFGDRLELPVIGIIDPVTGALMECWNGGIQNKVEFINELNRFVDHFDNNNPDAVIISDDSPNEPTEEVQEEIVEEPLPEEADETDEYKALFNKIEPKEYNEPSSDVPSTRIQFRMFNNGKRIIKKVSMEDKIRDLFAFCKHDTDNFPEGSYFELHLDGSNLIEHIDKTIEEMNLKMSSLTVEFIE